MNPCLRPTLPLWPDFDPNITHFWGPRVHDWSMAKAKTASNQLGICPWKMHVRPIPKVSIFMAVTTKKVMEKAQKWAKMARFWPKTRHNGRVMARKIFFHQCLWVTKFCAKFGRSRIPRTARMHNSLIVLRCMWKEPAPLETMNGWLIEWVSQIKALHQTLKGLAPFTYTVKLWKICAHWPS